VGAVVAKLRVVELSMIRIPRLWLVVDQDPCFFASLLGDDVGRMNFEIREQFPTFIFPYGVPTPRASCIPKRISIAYRSTIVFCSVLGHDCQLLAPKEEKARIMDPSLFGRR
jgi:hypothetical protein